jgi:hypothetical protein
MAITPTRAAFLGREAASGAFGAKMKRTATLAQVKTGLRATLGFDHVPVAALWDQKDI